jgi:5-methylcytosine-specific restriction endonuclease McrA
MPYAQAALEERRRVIPSHVKVEVWKRDKGQCVICGAQDELHFDHVVPYSKGGTSAKAKNVQLLCARHNLSKSDKIL